MAFSRRNIFERDHYTCQYCGVQPGVDELSIDHVFPRSQGGTSTWDNCVLACVECNKKKADRTPSEADMKLRKQPCRPQWKPLYAAHHVPHPLPRAFVVPQSAPSARDRPREFSALVSV